MVFSSLGRNFKSTPYIWCAHLQSENPLIKCEALTLDVIVSVFYSCSVTIPDCPDGEWGVDCSERCSDDCADTCDKEDGRCACNTGYEGVKCDQRKNNKKKLTNMS